MSLKSWIARLIPDPILQAILLRREMHYLAQVSTRECNVKHLAHLSDSRIRGFLNCSDIFQAWELVSSQINPFEIPDMTGGVNPGDRRALFHLAKGMRACSVLEIGTHLGASTVHLASAIDQNSKDKNQHPHLTTVDVLDVNDPATKRWLSHGSSNSPAQMIAALGFESWVDFQIKPSTDFLSSCSRRFDLIFLDGDHSAQTTYREIPAAMNLLNPGGIVVLHDFFPDLKPLWSDGKVIHGPFLAVERLIREGNPINALPLGELPWATKLDSNLTSLAIVTEKE